MSSPAVHKPRPGAKPLPAAAAQAFWNHLQQFADAADKVADAPRAALVEAGVRARTADIGASELAAELDQMAERIETIRGRLAAGSAERTPLVSPAERRRAEQAMRKLVDDGVLLPPAALAEGLQFTRQALSKALKSHRLFYVDVMGQRHYPAFFADPQYDRRQLEDVSRALGELPGASKLQFFLTRKASLEGRTPLQALARGQFSRVRAAAQGFAER